jgi:hypothetical protein
MPKASAKCRAILIALNILELYVQISWNGDKIRVQVIAKGKKKDKTIECLGLVRPGGLQNSTC